MTLTPDLATAAARDALAAADATSATITSRPVDDVIETVVTRIPEHELDRAIRALIQLPAVVTCCRMGTRFTICRLREVA